MYINIIKNMSKKAKTIDPVPKQDKLQFKVSEEFEVAFKNDDIFDKYGQVKKGKNPHAQPKGWNADKSAELNKKKLKKKTVNRIKHEAKK